MDKLASMRVFARVVERHGFAAAARDLNLSNAAVSKHVAWLEEELGVRLLNRTTRRLSLTEAGQGYHADVVRILEEIDRAERSAARATLAPRGTLRVNAPMSFGILHLSRVVPEFLARHPEVRVDLTLNDRSLDLVEHGFDVALRVRRSLPDSTLVARALCPIRRVLLGSPAYFARHGEPRHPADLTEHALLAFSPDGSPAVWRFDGPDGTTEVRVESRFTANNSLALRTALLEGTGVTVSPLFVYGDDIRAGRLRTALDGYEAEAQTLYAIHPAGRLVPPKVRAFVDFLVERLAPAPWEAGSVAGEEGKLLPGQVGEARGRG